MIGRLHIKGALNFVWFKIKLDRIVKAGQGQMYAYFM